MVAEAPARIAAQRARHGRGPSQFCARQSGAAAAGLLGRVHRHTCDPGECRRLAEGDFRPPDRNAERRHLRCAYRHLGSALKPHRDPGSPDPFIGTPRRAGGPKLYFPSGAGYRNHSSPRQCRRPGRSGSRRALAHFGGWPWRDRWARRVYHRAPRARPCGHGRCRQPRIDVAGRLAGAADRAIDEDHRPRSRPGPARQDSVGLRPSGNRGGRSSPGTTHAHRRGNRPRRTSSRGIRKRKLRTRTRKFL